MQHCLTDCMLIHEAALPAALQAGRRCSTAAVLQPWTRWRTATQIAGFHAMQQLLPDCRVGPEALLLAGLLVRTRCCTSGRIAARDAMQHFMPDCTLDKMQHCLPVFR